MYKVRHIAGLPLSLLAFVLGLSVLRIIFLIIFPTNLLPDEAQYWDWSNNLAWGYFSKPPVIAAIIAATTSLCGEGEACIRLGSPILHGLTAFILYGIGVRLYSPRVGFWSALTYITLPGVSFSATIITTDAPLLFFWAAGLYVFIRAIQEDSWRWWLLTGAMAGLGLQTKYSMVLFGVSIVFYLLLSGEWRQFLRQPKIYVAGALALLIYAPNIWWNWQNGFVSYGHTATISEVSRPNFDFVQLFDFMGQQAAIFGPLCCIALLLLCVKPRRLFDDHSAVLLVSFIVPLLGMIMGLSVLSRAFGNWAAPIYIAATVLVVAWLLERVKPAVLIASIVFHLFALGVYYNYYYILDAVGIELTRKNDPNRRAQGWNRVGPEVVNILREYPGSLLLVNERRLYAEFSYYARPREVEMVKWNGNHKIDDHYDMITTMEDKIGKDFIFVTTQEDATDVTPYFDMAIQLDTILLRMGDEYVFRYYVWRLKGFRGYDTKPQDEAK